MEDGDGEIWVADADRPRIGPNPSSVKVWRTDDGLIFKGMEGVGA